MFAGGFTLEAAEAVCGPDALDGIAALADHSLLTRDADRRFGMLETVREYALERLRGRTLDAVRDRARARLRASCSRAAERGHGGRRAAARWLGAARRRPRQRPRRDRATRSPPATPTTALALSAPLWRYWVMARQRRRGPRAAGRGARARAAGRRSCACARSTARASLAAEQGDFAAAKALLRGEPGAGARELGDALRGPRASSSNLGVLAIYAGDYDEAIRATRRRGGRARRSATRAGSALLLQNLGIAHAGAGHRDRGVALLEESVAARAGGWIRRTESPPSATLARLLLDPDGSGPALGLLHEALESRTTSDERPGLTDCLETAAALAADPRTGARLWGAAGALRDRRRRDPPARRERRSPSASSYPLRDALGPEAFTLPSPRAPPSHRPTPSRWRWPRGLTP